MLWIYKAFFPAVWLAFYVYWRIRAFNTKTTERIEPLSSRALRVLIFAVAICMLTFTRIPLPWIYLQLWPQSAGLFWLGAAVTVAGIGFAIWARQYLGRNWSASVTIKQDHELITTGPYSVVRHPIYTGILTGFLGMAIAIGQVRGLIVCALILFAFWLKLRMEEQWMRLQFGETYTGYIRQTSALVPYLF